jgi:hypothetical protein
MPFCQNWTFCRAFSPLDVAHVLTAGAPRCARARRSLRPAGRVPSVGSAHGLATDHLARAKPGARASPPSGCQVLRAPSGDWGLQRQTAPPSNPPTRLGTGAPDWAAGWTPLPHAPPCGHVAAPLRLRALHSACAPLACRSRAALTRLGLGRRPRHRLHREVGACTVLPDFAARSLATVHQSVCMARACGAPRTSSPGPLRGCGFRACPCHTAFSPDVSAR